MGRGLARFGPAAAAVTVALLAWALQALWIGWDSGPPESDEWHHLTKAEMFLRGWQRAGLAGVGEQMVFVRSAFPPLVHIAAVPAFVVGGGYSTDAAALSLGPWLALLVLASYGIGAATVGRGAGLTAALMVAGYPLVVSLSRKYLLDLTLASLVACSLWALLGSDRLRKPGRAWLAGALFGLALLAKFIAGVFLIGAFGWIAAPAAWRTLRRWPLRAGLVFAAIVAAGAWMAHDVVLWADDLATLSREPRSWLMFQLTTGFPPRLRWIWHGVGIASIALWIGARRVQGDELRAMLGLGAATAAAVWIAGCWYIPHGAEVLRGVSGFSSEGGMGEGDPGPGTLAGWLYYPWALGRAMPRAWFHLLVVGLIAGAAHPGLRRRLGPLLATVAAAYVVINLSHNKEVRYALSLCAPLAVISVGWATRLPRLPRALVWGTVAAMALSFATSWIPVHRGWWQPADDLVWIDDRVQSSGTTTMTGFTLPAKARPRDVVLTPDFYVVAPLPRSLPWRDDELPFGYIGP